MVALVAIAVSAVGWLNYRNLEQALLLRARDRIETHSRQLATDLEYYAASATRRCRGLSFRGGAARTDPRAQGGRHRSGRRRLRKGVARAAGVPLRGRTRSQARLCDAPDHRLRRRRPRACPRRSRGTERDGSDRARRELAASETIAAISRKRPSWAPHKSTSRRSISVAATDVIEEAHRPTLRIAAPIFDDDGKPFGIFMINVDMRRAFDRVRSSVGRARRSTSSTSRATISFIPTVRANSARCSASRPTGKPTSRIWRRWPEQRKAARKSSRIRPHGRAG